MTKKEMNVEVITKVINVGRHMDNSTVWKVYVTCCKESSLEPINRSRFNLLLSAFADSTGKLSKLDMVTLSHLI